MLTTNREPGPPTSAISTEEIRDRLEDPLLTIVDVRPLAGFNGWRLRGEVRGGHIPGSVAFPLAWLQTVDTDEVRRLLVEKGIVAGRTIAVYADDATDVRVFCDRLRDIGVEDVRVLHAGWSAWASEADLPVDRLPDHHRLVHAGWLRDVIDGGAPEAAPAGTFLVFHVNFDGLEEYQESHIPTALYLDTNWLDDPADWNRRSPEAIDEALRVLGVTSDTTVVLYGRDSEGPDTEKPGRRAGQIAATRAALILRYAGVDDVRLLDGGYDGWVGAGYPVESVARVPIPVASFGRPVPGQPDVIVDIEEAKRIIADQDGAALVSVRTWREHIGSASGYDYLGAAGRIAGDVWGNCGSDAYHMQHYRNVDNTMRAYPEIAANWQEVGITPDKRVAFYCGTGWRASEAWFYADVMGWPRISVYDGGWFEWSQDPITNPIEVGEPPPLAGR